MNQMLTLSARHASPLWSLLVVASGEIAPQVRCVSLVGEDLESFVHGSDRQVVLRLPTGKGDLRRACRVVGFDEQELRIDVRLTVTEDDPAAHWADAAQIGDPIAVELLDG